MCILELLHTLNYVKVSPKETIWKIRLRGLLIYRAS